MTELIVLLYFALFDFWVYLVRVLFSTVLFISQVIGCEDHLEMIYSELGGALNSTESNRWCKFGNNLLQLSKCLCGIAWALFNFPGGPHVAAAILPCISYVQLFWRFLWFACGAFRHCEMHGTETTRDTVVVIVLIQRTDSHRVGAQV